VAKVTKHAVSAGNPLRMFSFLRLVGILWMMPLVTGQIKVGWSLKG